MLRRSTPPHALACPSGVLPWPLPDVVGGSPCQKLASPRLLTVLGLASASPRAASRSATRRLPRKAAAAPETAAASAPRRWRRRQARRDALGLACSGRRDGTELRRRRELAEAAAERLANRPGRRHRRRLARQHLGLSPPADARRELGGRDAASGDERARRADQRARPSAAVRRAQHGLLRARRRRC